MSAIQPSDDLTLPPLQAGEGRLADNIVYFARALRKAGLKIGPGAIVDAVLAVEALSHPAAAPSLGASVGHDAPLIPTPAE